jgi:hypothetical protein
MYYPIIVKPATNPITKPATNIISKKVENVEKVDKMKSTKRGNDLYTYHTFSNVEFSGVLDKYKVYAYTRTFGEQPGVTTEFVSNMYDYHLFIRHGDKVYMDVKCVGDIVISFAELQKNKYWKHYYDLSLMLTNDKNFVMEDLEFDSSYHDAYLYEEKRMWSCNTSYIDGIYEYINGQYDFKTKKVVDNEFNCYFKINPYNLENMKYASQKDLFIFKNLYMKRYEVRSRTFNRKSIHYYNFVFDYYVSLMEKELDELSIIFESKKNIINLATLNDKEGMNGDILMIIYNHLANADENKKYNNIISELGNSNRLESIAQIIKA